MRALLSMQLIAVLSVEQSAPGAAAPLPAWSRAPPWLTTAAVPGTAPLSIPLTADALPHTSPLLVAMSHPPSSAPGLNFGPTGDGQQPPPLYVGQDSQFERSSTFMPMQWWYLDQQGVVQGPFSSNNMTEWFKRSYLMPTLLVRSQEDIEYFPLSALLRLSQQHALDPFCTPRIPFNSIGFDPRNPHPSYPSSLGFGVTPAAMLASSFQPQQHVFQQQQNSAHSSSTLGQAGRIPPDPLRPAAPMTMQDNYGSMHEPISASSVSSSAAGVAAFEAPLGSHHAQYFSNHSLPPAPYLLPMSQDPSHYPQQSSGVVGPPAPFSNSNISSTAVAPPSTSYYPGTPSSHVQELAPAISLVPGVSSNTTSPQSAPISNTPVTVVPAPHASPMLHGQAPPSFPSAHSSAEHVTSTSQPIAPTTSPLLPASAPAGSSASSSLAPVMIPVAHASAHSTSLMAEAVDVASGGIASLAISSLVCVRAH